MTDTPTRTEIDAETERATDQPDSEGTILETDRDATPATTGGDVDGDGNIGGDVSANVDIGRSSDASADTEAGRRSDGNGDASADAAAIRRYLTWGALGVCSLLAVFALLQFYGSATDAIDLWVAPKYQPLMQAAFNLVVLIGSLIGVSLLVRELN